MYEILAILLGLGAGAVTIVQSGRNAQAVRAVAVVGIFSGTFLVGAAAFAWALIDILMPELDIRITAEKKAAAKTKKK